MNIFFFYNYLSGVGSIFVSYSFRFTYILTCIQYSWYLSCNNRVSPMVLGFIHLFMQIINIHFYIQAYTNNIYFETSVVGIKYLCWSFSVFTLYNYYPPHSLNILYTRLVQLSTQLISHTECVMAVWICLIYAG